MSEITQLLGAIERGDRHAAAQLLPLVYDELRRLAQQRLRQETPGQTLDATSLVHEAFLRLVDDPEALAWANRGHFFAAAAEAMRRILIDRARHKHALKRGGGAKRVDLETIQPAALDRDDDLLALDEALAQLEQHDPEAAQLVKLRYFAGLSHQQAAESLGITRRAADRRWALAKAWLYQRLQEDS